MPKIVTFGEIMLRLSTSGQTRFVQSNSFDVCYGGGEANVALSLSNYGNEAIFVTKLPSNEIGQSAINAMRGYGVNTDYIVRGGNRIGIYFLETGASIRPSKVIYDRAASSISEAKADDFNFDKIFEGADWFHWTGISPALSKNCAEIIEKACIAAKKAGATISCDLNYRKKLWTPDEAQAVMRPLMDYVDVCIGNEEDAEMCLGFKPNADVIKGNTEQSGYYDIFKAMMKEFGFKYITSSLRESYSATHNGWKAMLYDGETFYASNHYDINPIVDRVGAGDSFAAGIIHGLTNGKPLQYALDFAVAASALKHTIPGDVNIVSIDEVESLMKGNTNGRVQR